MDTKAQREETLRVSRQAAQWLSTLEDGDEQDRKAFAEWLEQSALHVQEFLTLTAIDRYFDATPKDYPLELAKLRAAQTESVARLSPMAPDSVSGSSSAIRPRRTQRSWSTALAAAAAVVAVVLAGLWGYRAMSAQHYVTGIGEQRAIELEDGSVIHLNAQSSVEIRLSNAARDVRLTSGEALFKVKQDRLRPFKVYAGEAVIQAIGTEFNVYRQGADTTVAVLEGSVRISNPSSRSETNPALRDALTAGEEARVAAAGQVTVHRKADVARAVAWRQRRLVFDATPLPQIAAEFNRYNRRPQLRIEGDAARARKFTGVFDADDPESLVRVLSGVGRLEAVAEGDEVVVRER